MKRHSAVTDEMLDRLPVWARGHIDTLERKNVSLQNQLQRFEEERNVQLVGTDAPTRISWDYLMEGEHFLTSGANVRFYVGKELNRSQYITFRWDDRDKVLDVNSSNSLIIHPRASNSVYLTTEER